MAPSVTRRQALRGAGGLAAGAVAGAWVKPTVTSLPFYAAGATTGSPQEGSPCITCIAVSITNWTRSGTDVGHQIEGRVIIDNTDGTVPATVTSVFAQISVQQSQRTITKWSNKLDDGNACTSPSGCPNMLASGAVIPPGTACVFIYRAEFSGTVPSTGNDQLRHHIFVAFDDSTTAQVAGACEITANVNAKVTTLSGLPPASGVTLTAINLVREKPGGDCCGPGCGGKACLNGPVSSSVRTLAQEDPEELEGEADVEDETTTTSTTEKVKGKPDDKGVEGGGQGATTTTSSSTTSSTSSTTSTTEAPSTTTTQP